jgi:hypothetical protein
VRDAHADETDGGRETMNGEDRKKLYERLDVVASDLKNPDLTLPELVDALDTIQRESPGMWSVLNQWIRAHTKGDTRSADQESQLQNKASAMRVLQARLLDELRGARSGGNVEADLAWDKARQLDAWFRRHVDTHVAPFAYATIAYREADHAEALEENERRS